MEIEGRLAPRGRVDAAGAVFEPPRSVHEEGGENSSDHQCKTLARRYRRRWIIVRCHLSSFALLTRPHPKRSIRRLIRNRVGRNGRSLRIAAAMVSAANVRFLANAGQLRRLGFDQRRRLIVER